ncbi:MAG: bifunctional serine/threonine protein kinase/MFS transporter [Planctomycetota bacterium]
MNEFERSAGQGPLDPKKLLQQAIAGGDESAAAAGWQPPPLTELDQRFPELEIVELIGRGGMGAVYRAVQRKLARTVALKVLPPELAADPAFEERFLREARALATLEHPRILTVHDFGERDGFFYLVTEFVEGMNLRQLMDMGELSPQEALRLTPQVCEALQYAHDHGVVHRDIKPENLLVDGNGELKIADFGLARIVGEQGPAVALTRSTQVLGTPHYMAPEQWRSGANVDHRADIYSVGVVLYEMLTGQLPLGHFDPPSARQGVPKGLDQVVQRSLAQRPEQRYQRASEVGDELRRQHAEAPRPAATASPDVRHGEVGAPTATRMAWVMLILVFVASAYTAQSMYAKNTLYHATEGAYERRLAEAEAWAAQNDVPYDPMHSQALVEQHYREVLQPAWQARRQAAEEQRTGFFEEPPMILAEPGHNPSIAMSWIFAAGLGVASLLFTVLGFVGLSSIVARRRGPGGLGLTVFTAWIGPVALAATIPAVVLSENIRDNDTAVIVATIVAVAMAVLGIVFMVWNYHRMAARIVDDGPVATVAAAVAAPSARGPLLFAWGLLVLVVACSYAFYAMSGSVQHIMTIGGPTAATFAICGFVAVRRVRNSGSNADAGLAVLTAWLLPVLLGAMVVAATIAGGSGQPEQKKVEVTAAFAVTICAGGLFIAWQRRRLIHRA